MYLIVHLNPAFHLHESPQFSTWKIDSNRENERKNENRNFPLGHGQSVALSEWLYLSLAFILLVSDMLSWLLLSRDDDEFPILIELLSLSLSPFVTVNLANRTFNWSSDNYFILEYSHWQLEQPAKNALFDSFVALNAIRWENWRFDYNKCKTKTLSMRFPQTISIVKCAQTHWWSLSIVPALFLSLWRHSYWGVYNLYTAHTACILQLQKIRKVKEKKMLILFPQNMVYVSYEVISFSASSSFFYLHAQSACSRAGKMRSSFALKQKNGNNNKNSKFIACEKIWCCFKRERQLGENPSSLIWKLVRSHPFALCDLRITFTYAHIRTHTHTYTRIHTHQLIVLCKCTYTAARNMRGWIYTIFEFYK